MGLFDNLFSKKSNSSSEEIEALSARQSDYLGDAEQLANVVATGLESENYSGMNQQLASMAPSEQLRAKAAPHNC